MMVVTNQRGRLPNTTTLEVRGGTPMIDDLAVRRLVGDADG
jgi:hypothetical protein